MQQRKKLCNTVKLETRKMGIKGPQFWMDISMKKEEEKWELIWIWRDFLVFSTSFFDTEHSLLKVRHCTNFDLRLLLRKRKAWLCMDCHIWVDKLDKLWPSLNLEWNDYFHAFFKAYTALPTKIKHPRYDIRMYWTIFCHHKVRIKQNIFEKTHRSW